MASTIGASFIRLVQKLFPSLFRQCNNRNFACDASELAKHIWVSYPSSLNRTTAPFMIIHSDVWRPSSDVSIPGFQWSVTFIDCFSRVTWLYSLHHKSDVFSCFKVFHKMIATQFDTKIRILRTDNGREYVNSEFQG